MTASDEPVIEIHAGGYSRKTTKKFFLRADESTEGELVTPSEPEDWRTIRLREILTARAERLGDREDATFRLPWDDLLRALGQVAAETDPSGSDVDRDAVTLMDVDAAAAATVLEGVGSAALTAAQQDASYLRGKLAESEHARQELQNQLDNLEEAAEATHLQLGQASGRQEEAERAMARSEEAAARWLDQLEGLKDQVAQAEAEAEAAGERARSEAQAETDQVRLELVRVQGELSSTRSALSELGLTQVELEAKLEASRNDSTTIRRRFVRTRKDLEERIDALEEELQRRAVGQERERESLLRDLRQTERVLRDLFGRLPEQELRAWVPGLAREPWNEETAIRHLACLLERLDEYRSERRQARLLPVPPFDEMLERVQAGRSLVPARSQPRLARLKQELEQAQLRFEALREAHVMREARLGEMIELNAVVAQGLAHERELKALGL